MGVLGPEGQKGRKYRNRKNVTICGQPGCQNRLGRMNKTGLCRTHFMMNLHKDPSWDARHRAKASERLKKLHQQDWFKKQHSELTSARMKKLGQTEKWKERGLALAALHCDKLKTDPEYRAAHIERSRKKMIAYNAKRKSDA